MDVNAASWTPPAHSASAPPTAGVAERGGGSRGRGRGRGRNVGSESGREEGNGGEVSVGDASSKREGGARGRGGRRGNKNPPSETNAIGSDAGNGGGVLAIPLVPASGSSSATDAAAAGAQVSDAENKEQGRTGQGARSKTQRRKGGQSGKEPAKNEPAASFVEAQASAGGCGTMTDQISALLNFQFRQAEIMQQAGAAGPQRGSAQQRQSKKGKKQVPQAEGDASAAALAAASTDGRETSVGGSNVSEAVPAAAEVGTTKAARNKKKKKDKAASEAREPADTSISPGVEAQGVEPNGGEIARNEGGGEIARNGGGATPAAAGKQKDKQKDKQKQKQKQVKENVAKGVKQGEASGRSGRRWWSRLDVDDPISLDSIGALKREPFCLYADEAEQVPVYFEGRMLANYLVSSNKFEHPTSRRPLTKEDCAALDEYCKKHRLGYAAVQEALLEKERLEDPSERVRMLREQASAIVSSFFSQPRGQASDVRRSRQPQQQHRAPAPPQPEEYAGFGLIDDDEAGAFYDEFGGGWAGAGAAPSRPAEAFPSLGGSGYAPAAPIASMTIHRDHSSPSVKIGPLFVPDDVASVFHVSKLTQATKTKHISSLFTPHQSIIKWIDDHGVLVLIPKISYEVALRACCLNNPKGFTIVPLSELQAAVEAKAAGGSRANWRGRIGPNTMLPGQGELRFMLAQMVSQAQKAESDAAEAAAKRREGLDDEDLDEDAEYQRWLVSRWASSGPMDAGLGAGHQDDPFWHEEKAARRVKSLIEAEKMDDWEQESDEGDGEDDSPAARSSQVQVDAGAPPAASAPAAAPSETTAVGGGDSVGAADASGSTQANAPVPSVE